jgi:hypothetical protein
MRTKVALGVTAMAIAGVTMVPAPAYACHDIMYSENPVHNWMCATVHETGVEDRVAAYLRELYCAVTHDPACS